MLNVAPQGVKKSRRKIGKTYIGGGRVRSASPNTGARFSCVFFHIKKRRILIMKKTTNIYFLIDCSVKSAYGINTQAYRAVIKADRALTCSKFPVNVQTHIIGYNERAFFLNMFRAFPMAGKARFGEGLKLLKTSIEMQRQIQAAQTRSIFLWYSSGEVFGEWKKPLSDLFRQPEFANGLRYSVQIQPQMKEPFMQFADFPDRILPYFSENRLCSLIQTLTINH